jgi:hypothetical protein
MINKKRSDTEMTKAEMKKAFEAYYAELKAEANADGFKVNRAYEWESFREHRLSIPSNNP